MITAFINVEEEGYIDGTNLLVRIITPVLVTCFYLLTLEMIIINQTAQPCSECCKVAPPKLKCSFLKKVFTNDGTGKKAPVAKPGS